MSTRRTNIMRRHDTHIKPSLPPVPSSPDVQNFEESTLVTLSPAIYKLECWGAQGNSYSATYKGGTGGYSWGTLTVNEPTDVYVNVGKMGTSSKGGEASDIRVSEGDLKSRFIVAGGGSNYRTTEKNTVDVEITRSYAYRDSSGQLCVHVELGDAPKTGYVNLNYCVRYYDNGDWTYIIFGSNYSPYVTEGNSFTGTFETGKYPSSTATIDLQLYEAFIYVDSYYIYYSGYPGGGTSGLGSEAGTQSSGASFGLGSNGGGDGWYGGNNAGGSGFVNIESNASYLPTGYTGLLLDEGETIAGNMSITEPNGVNATGHYGNGHIRITKIGDVTPSLPIGPIDLDDSQEITLPAGLYKVQTWGAQGLSYSSSYAGGKGGYSEGIFTLTSPTTLYANVGKAGTSSKGGGASDLRMTSDDLNSRFIVAGGGSNYSYTESTSYEHKYEVVLPVTSVYCFILQSELQGFENPSGKYSGFYDLQALNNAYPEYAPFTLSVRDRLVVSQEASMNQPASADITYDSDGNYVVNWSSEISRLWYNEELFPNHAPQTIGKEFCVLFSIRAEGSKAIYSESRSSGYPGGGTSGLGTGKGTQKSGASFGFGTNNGGDGWYGGNNAGGSGFVNIAGNTASPQSTGIVLESGTTIAGNTSFESVDGNTETGHAGNGHIRITPLGYMPGPDTNGHQYVDLGLPSGTLWAKYNVGATSESDGGLFFAWADIEGCTKDEVGYSANKKPFTKISAPYQTSTNYYTSDDLRYTKYLGSTTTYYKDVSATNENALKTVLDLSDDAAHVHMGGSWRMPTKEDIQELLDNTNYSATGNAVKFVSKTNPDKYILIPDIYYGLAHDGSVSQGACIWSSSLNTDMPCTAYYFSASLPHTELSHQHRGFGLFVRGVIG